MNSQIGLLDEINTKLENNLNINISEQSKNLKVFLNDDEYLIYRNEELNLNVQTVSLIPAKIYGINIINLQDNFAYIKFYDTNDNIDISFTVPKEVLAVPRNSVLLIEPKSVAFSHFLNSIKIIADSQLKIGKNGALAENIFIEIKYKI